MGRMRRLDLGRLHASAARTDIGGLLVTLGARTRSLQAHIQVLRHRPPNKR